MNIIFGLIVLLSILSLTFSSPESVLSAMLTGGEKALDLTAKMIVIYAVWLGISNIFESTGITKKTAKILKPFNEKLFGRLPDKANDYLSFNLSANLLGFSGATTPFGIKTIDELKKYDDTDYAVSMFFVINATSIQLIPTSVLALRSSFNSVAPSSVVLPTVLATALSTFIGVLLVKTFIKKPKGRA